MGLKLKRFKNLLISRGKIALDSSCFIYHIEKNRNYIDATRIIFKELLPEGNIQAISSTLVITEILTKPYKLGRSDLALAYRTLIKAIPNFYLITPNEEICDSAAQIRSRYGFKTPDAIHLATAIDQKTPAIVGNDKRWKRIKEIRVLNLDDYC